MRSLSEITAIDILWDGPYSLQDIGKNFFGNEDHGVYQIYGTHAIFGPDTLLYIGKAEDGTFSQRILAHREWIDWEPNNTCVFLGRISGQSDPATLDPIEWKKLISRAEALLIYYCTPPYNSQHIKTLRNEPATIVLNYRRHHRLPLMVSNIYEMTPVWEVTFKPYGSK
jgi:hypothetical protein